MPNFTMRPTAPLTTAAMRPAIVTASPRPDILQVTPAPSWHPSASNPPPPATEPPKDTVCAGCDAASQDTSTAEGATMRESPNGPPIIGNQTDMGGFGIRQLGNQTDFSMGGGLRMGVSQPGVDSATQRDLAAAAAAEVPKDANPGAATYAGTVAGNVKAGDGESKSETHADGHVFLFLVAAGIAIALLVR